MHSEYCNLCFSELCDRYMLGTDREDNEKYMTVLNSINCIFCWCQSKNIPVDHFIWELVSVMNRIHFKKTASVWSVRQMLVKHSSLNVLCMLS